MQFTDIANGVPFLAVPPSRRAADAPVVVAWHLADPPSTESSLAAALPLAGLDAWKIYLGLPMHSTRGIDREEYLRLGYEDAVVNQFGPISDQARREFPGAYAALQDRFGFDPPLAVLGGSLGSAVAQLVAIDRADVVAMGLVSPVARLRSIVAANERRFGVTYPWHPAADGIADRLDFAARAAETAEHAPAVRIVVGERDDEAIRASAVELREALATAYADPSRVDLVTVPGMPHAFAEGPDQRPTVHAAEVDRLMVGWLRRASTVSACRLFSADTAAAIARARQHSLGDLPRRTARAPPTRSPSSTATSADVRRVRRRRGPYGGRAGRAGACAKGDRLALLAHNCWQFAVLDVRHARGSASSSCRSTSCSARTRSRFILEHSGATAFVVEDALLAGGRAGDRGVVAVPRPGRGAHRRRRRPRRLGRTSTDWWTARPTATPR